jgi:hypothetical protein
MERASSSYIEKGEYQIIPNIIAAASQGSRDSIH